MITRAEGNSFARLAKFTFFALCIWEIDQDLIINKEVNKISDFELLQVQHRSLSYGLRVIFLSFVFNDLLPCSKRATCVYKAELNVLSCSLLL